MYQITGNTVSFKVNEQEREEFNKIAEFVQTAVNSEFKNAKQVVFALYSLVSNLETNGIQSNPTVNESESESNQPNTLEFDLVNESIQPISTESNEFEEIIQSNTTVNTSNLIREKFISLMGYDNDPSDEEIIEDLEGLFEELNTVPEIPEPVKQEIQEIMKIYNDEGKLIGVDAIIHLNPSQYEVLVTIARWRKQANLDQKTNSINELIKRMLFNRGTLLNDHGQFPTGINLSHFKKTQN